MKHPTLRLALRLALAAAAATLSFLTSPSFSKTPGAQPEKSYSHLTAPTKFVDVNGTQIAYRRFGPSGGIPVVFFQHFVGNLDSWDPKIADGIAKSREVILFDNAGVGSSGGEVPPTVDAMAQEAVAFLGVLGIHRADLLGFSLGSLVAQEVTFEKPELVRKLILVGSGPRGGVGMATLTPEFQALLSKKYPVPDELALDALFTPSEASQAAGRAFLERVRARKVHRDTDPNEKVAPAQVAAFAAWGAPSADSNAYLKSIKAPVLVVSGSHDIVHYTVNSYDLQQNLPNAQLVIYPDSSHGSFDQYPDLFVKQVDLFLGETR